MQSKLSVLMLPNTKFYNVVVRQTDVRQHHRLMPPPGGGGIINKIRVQGTLISMSPKFLLVSSICEWSPNATICLSTHSRPILELWQNWFVDILWNLGSDPNQTLRWINVTISVAQLVVGLHSETLFWVFWNYTGKRCNNRA